MAGPSLSSSNLPTKLPASALSPQAQQSTQASKPNYDPFASFTSSQPASQSTTPAPALGKPQQPARQPSGATDPFAILSNPAPRQSSPFNYQQQTTNLESSTSSSLFDFGQASNPPSQQPHSTQVSQRNKAASTEEEWTFASSLPDQSHLPPVNEVAVTDTAVNIVFAVSRPAGDDKSITMVVRSSNNTPELISDFTFQIAVTRVSLVSP